MAAYQASLSLGFSRQEHWMGCHFLLQCMKVKSGSEIAQSCPTPRNPMDCSLPGSSVHGIFQARVLEWGAIAFYLLIGEHSCIQQKLAISHDSALCCHQCRLHSVQSLSCARLFETPWTACSTPCLPVHHQLPELTQTHVH